MPNINLGSMSGLKTNYEHGVTLEEVIKDIQMFIEPKREYTKDSIKHTYDKKNYA